MDTPYLALQPTQYGISDNIIAGIYPIREVAAFQCWEQIILKSLRKSKQTKWAKAASALLQTSWRGHKHGRAAKSVNMNCNYCKSCFLKLQIKLFDPQQSAAVVTIPLSQANLQIIQGLWILYWETWLVQKLQKWWLGLFVCVSLCVCVLLLLYLEWRR